MHSEEAILSSRQLIQNSIFSDMSEGAMAIRFDGVIELVNDAALRILGKRREDLEGRSFAMCFFEDEANDAFSQSVLDAVYLKGRRQESYVPYTAGGTVRQLRIVSSFLRHSGNAAGVILVISDITELTQMRDAVLAMEKIRGLNQQLELRNRVLQETFGRYLSDEVVREILDSPEGWKLGGQKRKLTIMMSDLRGFSMLCERMAPQDLIGMLNHYFSEMYEEIRQYNGTLIEFLGDGMFVIFGAPVSMKNHAADAVACAIGMQRRMKRVNEWNVSQGYEPLSMGIGINTDEVILGNIGSEKRTKYGVLGSAVNLAGRIESYTTEGQVLISEKTRRMIRGELAVDHVFEAVPKGMSDRIRIFAVAGIGAPYHVCLDAEKTVYTLLPEPVPVSYCIVEGKHVDGTLRRGFLLGVSDRYALLQPVSLEEAVPEEETAAGENREAARENAIDLYDDLCLKIGGGLYAKAVAKKEGGSLVRFTAKPIGFASWLEGILQGSFGQGLSSDRPAAGAES